MVGRPAVARLESKVILLSVSAAMFAWVMQALLDFYFHYCEKSYPEVLLLDIPPRELYSRVAITAAFLCAGVIISRMIRKVDAAERKTAHLNTCLQSIRSVNRLITRETDRLRLIQGACDRLVGNRGYAWVKISLRGAWIGVSADAEDEAMQGSLGPTETATAPLQCGTHVYGELSAAVPADLVSDSEERALLGEVAEDIAFAMHGIGIEEERERVEAAQRFLCQVGGNLGGTRGSEDVGSMIQSGLAHVLDTSALQVVLCDEKRNAPAGRCRAAAGGEERAWVPAERTLPWCVAKSGMSLLLTGGQVERMIEEGTIRDGDGPPRAWLGVPIKAKGQVIGVVSVRSSTDRTAFGESEVKILESVCAQVGTYLERKRAEEELREQGEELQVILDSVPAYIFYKDTEGRYIRVNKALADITETLSAQWTGKTAAELLPGRAKAEEEDDQEVISSGQAKRGVVDVLEVPGGSRWVQTDRIPQRDKDGNVVGVIGLSVDITDRKLAEDALESKDEQLRQSQKMEAIGLLAGGVAHDFNNLLTAISGYAELALQRVCDDDPIVNDLEAVKAATTRAAALSHQLLAFSRRQPLQLKASDLRKVVDGLRGMLQRLIGEDIECIIESEPDLQPVEVDRSQIEQAVINLAINARDAMPDGGRLTISMRNVTLDEKQCASIPEAEPGTFACLSVSDTGTGMDSETLERIFEPFFTTKERGCGSGLGLSGVYGNIKQHGGWIQVYSEVGVGSTFHLYLPVAHEQPDLTCEEVQVENPPHGSGERILLVEDEQLIRDFAARALRQGGYAVVEAETAEEALQVFDTNRQEFDLIFTDVVLPGKTGVQLVDEVHTRSPDSHVLLCSGYADSKSQWSHICQRGLRFLEKPYSVRDLLAAVHGILH